VLELRDVHKKYGSLTVFAGLDFDIDRGDRIAFVGVNGAGKSTLSRIIAGVEPIDKGERKVGYNVVVSYFAQHQAEELNQNNDVLQTVDEVAIGEIRKRLRNLLGCFLFRGDDVFKKVKVLSGGEKSRLALAKMLLQPTNLIVMDEPTNHLDMRSKTILQEALKKFEGSYVIVSHDRDFLDPIVNKVIEFKQGRIKTYPGNVSDYLYSRQNEQQLEAVSKKMQSVSTKTETGPTEKERKRLEAQQRQKLYNKTKPVKEKIARLEKVIEQLEAQKLDCEALMGDPAFYHNGERVKEVTAKYKTTEKELSDAYYKWNELTKELEKMCPPAAGAVVE
jgi:ATP-binding cassette subfamily F protein 3